MRKTNRGLVLVLGSLLLAGGVAIAQEGGPQAAPDPTPEQRSAMAAMHRKMADCLASDRPIAECRAEMHAGCMQIMGANGCPMMGGMGHPGMMGGGMGGPGTMGGMGPGAPKEAAPRDGATP